MKNLEHAKRILDMEINWDMSNSCSFVHQTPYELKILKKIGMLDYKSTFVSFGTYFVLSKEQSFANEEENDFMSKVPYSNVIDFVMYFMVALGLI